MSSGELFKSSKDEKRFKSLLDSYKKERTLGRDDVRWLMERHKQAYDRYLSSSPHKFHSSVLENDALMLELEKVSAGFTDASQCFGFDMQEYNDAFRNYDKGITAALQGVLESFRSTLNEKNERHAAVAVHEDLELRVQVAFGAYPEWRFRVPVLTPSTFGAMAETFMKFPGAITEVWLLEHLPVSLRLSTRTPLVADRQLDLSDGTIFLIPRRNRDSPKKRHILAIPGNWTRRDLVLGSRACA